MLEFCTGSPPFSKLTDEFCWMKIKNKVSPLDFYLENEYAGNTIVDAVTELRDLLKICFSNNIQETPSAKDLLRHPFFSPNTSMNYYQGVNEVVPVCFNT